MSEEYLQLSSETRNLAGFRNVTLNPGPEFYSKIINEENLSRGSYRVIYLNHILEFLSPEQAQNILRKCRYLLKSNGVLRVVTLDLDKLVKIYDKPVSLLKKKKMNIPPWITNGCELFNTVFRKNGIKWVYVQEEVRRLAEKVGLKPIGLFNQGKSGRKALRGLETGEEFLLIYEFKNSPKQDAPSLKQNSPDDRNESDSIDYSKLMPDKLKLIDFAFSNLPLKSFADLGGVWGVNAGYTFYTLKNYTVARACLVDTNFNEIVRQEKKKYPRLQIIEGNFGDPAVAATVGRVDVIFLFDVLLHQVKPDWDEILQMYASRTNTFIIFNQQYVDAARTVRLLDLGKEEYFRIIPHSIEEGQYRQVFEKMYEMHPVHNRIYRDIHNVWQWGITDADLRAKMSELGFEMKYYRDCGFLGDITSFKNMAYVFTRI